MSLVQYGYSHLHIAMRLKKKHNFCHKPAWLRSANKWAPWAPSNPGITAYRNKSNWAIIWNKSFLAENILWLVTGRIEVWSLLRSLGFMGSQHGYPRAQNPPRNMPMYFYMLLYCLYKVRKENAHVYMLCPLFGVSEPMGSTPGVQHTQTHLSGVGVRGGDVWHARNSHSPIAMQEKMDVTKFVISKRAWIRLQNKWAPHGLPPTRGSLHTETIPTEP